MEHEKLQRIGRRADEYAAELQVKQDEEKQKWEKEKEQEKVACAAQEYDMHLQARKQADDDELEQQCNLLLVQQAARETVCQMDYEHEQVQVAKERKAAELRERDKIAQACLEQYEEDREELR